MKNYLLTPFYDLYFQLFLNCLCNLQTHQILTEIDVESLFYNIPEIYAANRVFWQQHIIPMLKSSRESKGPLDPTLLRQGFLKFEDIFSPYSRYCSEQTNCQEYCKEQDRTNEIFKAYLAVSYPPCLKARKKANFFNWSYFLVV